MKTPPLFQIKTVKNFTENLMFKVQSFDILKDGFDFHQEIKPNTNFKMRMYSNFIIQSIYIDSISSSHFDTICSTIHLNPLVTFAFQKIADTLYFAFVCQNQSCVIKVDDNEKLHKFLSSIENTTMIASKKKDLKILKEYVEAPKFSFLNEAESLDSRYEAKTLIRNYYKINGLDFDSKLTIGRYLFLSSRTLFGFFLRRNYFPTSTFVDSSFLNPPVFEIDQSKQKKQKKIPKLEESDFLKIRVIGYGSNSVISLVVHKITGFVYALRTITKKEYYKCEYEYFEKNIHPRIIHCYGVVSEGANKAFLLDFMCNGSLKDKKITDPSMKSKIIYQTLIAIDYLHSRGLIHCDIKPSSILLNRDFDVCLSGFSHIHENKFIDKKTIKVDLFPYLAPEFICSSDKCSFHADLYSLGVLIYFLTTGKDPYNGIALLEAIRKGAKGDIDCLSKTEGQITKLFEKCTSSDKSDRSSSFILRRLFENKYLYYADTDEEIMAKLIEHEKSQKIDNEWIDSDKRIDAKYILKNAQNGNPSSQYDLGLMYSNGWIVERNDLLAFEWFSKAAEQNYSLANFEIGLFYHRKADKIKMPFDYEKSFDMYKKTADQGLSDAENGIGKLYLENHLPKDESNINRFTKAIEYFTKAADKGNHQAQYNLGKLLLSDESGQINIEKALEYLNLSASQGNDEAEVLLAKIYSEGKIVTKNDQKAAQFYKKAAYHNRVDAMKMYGQMLIEGKGIPINKDDGEKWIQKSNEIEKES